MKRVLFVDGEPRILEGLRRMLRPQGHEREKAFAPGGEAVRAIVCLTIFLGKLGLL